MFLVFYYERCSSVTVQFVCVEVTYFVKYKLPLVRSHPQIETDKKLKAAL